ncbi:MAG: hypothetical protein L0G96_00460 [Acinetobacter sp.]|nr:hypothetical protein [Acinetobacter sp.]
MLSLSDIVNVKVGIGRGVFEAPGATVIGGNTPTFDQQILKLFSNGEQGFFYDPNDLSTMYQDAGGTVPVTAAGQAVGLILDKSKGLALGSNLIPNGSFSSDTAWGKGAGWTIADGVARFDGSAAFSNLGNTTPSSINGKWLRVELDLSNVGTLVTQVRILVSGALAATIPVSGAGKYSARVLGGSVPSIGIQSQGQSGANYAFTLDNVSVKEAFGSHAYQSTSASRPILRQNATTGANYLEFDGADDFLQTAVSLPFPVTAVAPFDFKSNTLMKCILSAGAAGYLRSTETMASVHSVAGGGSIAKKKVDVLLHELTGDSVNIRSNSDAIMMSVIENNPYIASNKYIGSFSDTHTTLRAAMDLYGMVVIRKVLSTSEEAELRAHFNKRMGI